ncbi:ribbon-helix-helix protein, CopG family [Rhizobium cremeum]|uniref:CopG family ribbon-helix-helix protein n=1 Tax=Rhizobium cremeum TaxID=2813827 RepID=UPI000DDDDAB0
MHKGGNLSDPLTLRLPVDVLGQVEEVARICERSRSWVIVRALKSYLASEGRELIELAEARAEVDGGAGVDLDDVIRDLENAAKDAAA